MPVEPLNPVMNATADRAEVGAGVEGEDLSGQTVLVTGATGGIGRETALALGRLGARVLVHGRDREKGEAVLDALAETDADGADLLLADFASLAAVEDLLADVREYDRLDAVVANAGGVFDPGVTGDGIERTFAINHLAHFRLVTGLLDRLDEADGRVVVVSSAAHRGGRLDLSTLRTETRRSRWGAYSDSKLANVLFARELARRLERADSSVTANSLHPGAIPGSGFARGLPAPLRAATELYSALPSALQPLTSTVVEGAQTPTYLVASPEVAEVTGEYFVDCQRRRPARAARDGELARRLWTVSADLADVDPDVVAASVTSAADEGDTGDGTGDAAA
jgi:NAD(P)-dependent dehydrogenase (short-subunit alcohol dehydrogenase family)